MSFLDDIVGALFGPSKPPTFDQRWSEVYPQFLQQHLDPVSNYNIEKNAKGDYDMTYKKMDDSPTSLQDIRNYSNVLRNRLLNPDRGYPALDPNTLTQLLNPDATMGQKTTADLPSIAQPDYKAVINPFNYELNQEMDKLKSGQRGA